MRGFFIGTLFSQRRDVKELTFFTQSFKIKAETEMDDRKEHNCRFINGNERFAFRAAALIVEEGYVLLATNAVADYYYTIGGAVHFGETAETAAEREALEETGIEYRADRLIIVNENFFRDKSASVINKYDSHEVCLYYLMKSRGERPVIVHKSECADGEEHKAWLPMDKLDEYKILPEFLPEVLKALPDGIVHIITDDRK